MKKYEKFNDAWGCLIMGLVILVCLSWLAIGMLISDGYQTRKHLKAQDKKIQRLDRAIQAIVEKDY